jgi:hypothetical protein
MPVAIWQGELDTFGARPVMAHDLAERREGATDRHSFVPLRRSTDTLSRPRLFPAETSPASPPWGDLEVIDADEESIRGPEVQDAIAQLEPGDHPATHRNPGAVDRLIEIVRRGRRFLVRPQGVDQLISIQAVARREGQDLHEVGCLPESPRGGRDAPSSDFEVEVAR